MHTLTDVDRWAAAHAASSQSISTRVSVLIDDDEIELETVGDCSVTQDATSAIRGRCDLTVIDDGTFGLVPTQQGDLLTPYGQELQIERGIVYDDGTVERIHLGIFRIDEVEATEVGDSLTLRITGQDRAAIIADAKFEQPYQVTAGTDYLTAIETVLTDAYDDIITDFDSVTLDSPLLTAQEGEDAWEFAQGMATAIGMELYFDHTGVCVLRRVPSFADDPVWEIVDGENGVLVEASKPWVREPLYNAVIVTGENTGEVTSVRGVARDLDPLSPTYYFGSFGKKPMFYSHPGITTATRATEVAISILARQLGRSQPVNFGAIVNPALEPSDVVLINRERVGIANERHIIDSITIPLGPEGAMTGTTRIGDFSVDADSEPETPAGEATTYGTATYGTGVYG